MSQPFPELPGRIGKQMIGRASADLPSGTVVTHSGRYNQFLPVCRGDVGGPHPFQDPGVPFPVDRVRRFNRSLFALVATATTWRPCSPWCFVDADTVLRFEPIPAARRSDRIR